MTGRARDERRCQQAGAGGLRAGRLVAAVILAAVAMPAFAMHAGEARAVAGRADAVVAKLRDLPPPRRPLAHGRVPGKPALRPLPALEVRRQRVYDELHSLGPASVTALARALRDPDPQMRRNVAVALDVLGGGWWHFPDGGSKLDLRPALPALLGALQDSNPGVRAWVAQDIGDMGAAAATAVPRLRVMLHSPDPESRGGACGALGRIGAVARGALPDLRQALDDPSAEVRQAARDAIARIDRAAARRRPNVE